jgi:hypothetical protein
MRKFCMAAATLSTLLLTSLTVFTQTPSREDILKEIRKKHAELAVLEKDFLAPDENDRERYADFLRQSDTGIIRLLPREKFDSETYKDQKKSIVMRGGGAYYSFTRLTHEYGFGSDLELEHGFFKVGFAGADYGFMTDLGDVPIETVSPDTHAVTLFGAYQAAREEPLARKEYRKFADGADLDGVPVNCRVPVRSHSTYLLRSINYRESDVLVAFKVVRIDPDGSTTIVWKLLKKDASPKLNRSEPIGIG